jgi:hypothetical protein
MPEEIPSNEAEEVDEAPSVKKGKKSRRKKQAHNNESEQPAGEREYETVAENGKKQESAQNPPPAVNQVLQTSITQPPPSVPESGQSKSGNADVSSNGAAANPTQRTDSTMSGSDTVEKAGMEKILRGIFVEPIVAVGSVAKDAGETALKPVKQVDQRIAALSIDCLRGSPTHRDACVHVFTFCVLYYRSALKAGKIARSAIFLNVKPHTFASKHMLVQDRVIGSRGSSADGT